MDKSNLYSLCGGLGLCACFFQCRSWVTSKTPSPPGFFSFQLKYLVVSLMMRSADWLQGPYVYQLYAEKGFSEADSAQMFLIGFASSGFLGVGVGNLADRYGRKKGCLMFTVLYSSACMLYHSQDYYTLVLGRIFSGIATSLLLSAFEAWYKAEHEKLKFPDALVSQTFSRHSFGDGLLAIAAGFLASGLVGYTESANTPFDASAVILILGGILMFFWWGENKSEKREGADVGVIEAFKTIMANKEILLCGVVQSFFGGTMYVFVFMWTPSLRDCDPGLVFSCFMVAIMIGAGVFQEIENRGFHLVDIVCMVICIAAVSLSIPIFFADSTIRLAAFICYEIAMGMWFPAYHTMRLKLVPNHGHATVLSFFRFPLNCFVIMNLLFFGKVQSEIIFTFCFYALCAALVCMLGIRHIVYTDKGLKQKMN